VQMTTCLQPLLNKLSSAINNGDESWDYRNPHIARIAISVYPSIAFRKTNRHCELIKHCLRRTVSFNRCYSTRRKLTHVSQRLCPSANRRMACGLVKLTAGYDCLITFCEVTTNGKLFEKPRIGCLKTRISIVKRRAHFRVFAYEWSLLVETSLRCSNILCRRQSCWPEFKCTYLHTHCREYWCAVKGWLGPLCRAE